MSGARDLAAVVIGFAVVWPAAASPGDSAGGPAASAPRRAPKPDEFASVFSFGYGQDHMPADEAAFEQLLRKIKAAGFNVIHTSYTDRRLALCKKHGVRLMIDFLDVEHHHVYKNLAGCQAVCAKVRGDRGVWGYNIWNDNMHKVYRGRIRDIDRVREWDPTHPAYCGGYRTYGLKHLRNADVLGYYDFHWRRGLEGHFRHLLSALSCARACDGRFYTWLGVRSGQAGRENFRRCLWSANTAIACGLKGVLWFLGGDLIDRSSLEWKPAGRDIAKVNAEIMPLKAELAALGNPAAVYATSAARTPDNRPLPGGKTEAMLPGLEGRAVPAGFWLQPAGGEFVVGVFRDGRQRDAAFVANLNALAPQQVKLKLLRRAGAELFRRKTGKWQPVTPVEGAVCFRLDAGGGELLRFRR